MAAYEVVGVVNGVKNADGTPYCFVHYLMPLKRGEGVRGNCFYFSKNIDVHVGDMITPVYEISEAGKPYVTGVTVLD